MTKEWFVLHTLTGQEGNVQKSIAARAVKELAQEYVGECVIPMQNVTVKKEGQKPRTVKRKKFPGYVVVQLALYGDAQGGGSAKRPVIERTWQFVRATPGVMGFLGGDRPLPLRPDELESVLGAGSGQQAEEKIQQRPHRGACPVPGRAQQIVKQAHQCPQQQGKQKRCKLFPKPCLHTHPNSRVHSDPEAAGSS